MINLSQENPYFSRTKQCERYMLVYIREDCAEEVLKVPDPKEAPGEVDLGSIWICQVASPEESWKNMVS